MALSVINDIKVAESKAGEIRRTAAAAAKDYIKLAIEENAQIREREIGQIRQIAAVTVEAAGEEAKIELESLGAQRNKEREELKTKAEKKLARAADMCLERILR